MIRRAFIYLAALWLAFAAFSFTASAQSADQERITNFDITLDVQADGSLIVTESIDIIANGDQIKRGIFREFPRYYDFMGVTLENDYKIISATKNGAPENQNISYNGNAMVLRLGSRNIILKPGLYRYEIKYSLPEQIRLSACFSMT